MLPDQPRDANNLLRKVILGNIFNRFFTVPKALAHSFHVDFNCSLRGRRRLPRANISSYRQALYKEKISILFCRSRTRISLFYASLDRVHILPLSLCIASTYVWYAYLWYDFIVLVSNNMQQLFYCDMYCFEVCYVMISMHFLCICCCVFIRAHCNPISNSLRYNSI